MTRISPAQRAEIERLCSYISDDSTIASYMHLPKEAVAKVRGSMVVPVWIGRRKVVQSTEPIQDTPTSTNAAIKRSTDTLLERLQRFHPERCGA